MLPAKLYKKYFWDVRRDDVKLRQNSFFIIERILENGDEEAFRWLEKQFPRKTILGVLQRSRRISPRSRRYWEFYFNLWRKNKKPSSAKKLSAIWGY
jgi:hypothetical protein